MQKYKKSVKLAFIHEERDKRYQWRECILEVLRFDKETLFLIWNDLARSPNVHSSMSVQFTG